MTRNDGTYTFGMLASGVYKVKVVDNRAHQFVTQYFAGSATNAGATPVPVVADQTASGIDLTLTPAPAPDPATVVLSGVVTDQDGVPVRGVAVSAHTGCGPRTPWPTPTSPGATRSPV